MLSLLKTSVTRCNQIAHPNFKFRALERRSWKDPLNKRISSRFARKRDHGLRYWHGKDEGQTPQKGKWSRGYDSSLASAQQKPQQLDEVRGSGPKERDDKD